MYTTEYIHSFQLHLHIWVYVLSYTCKFTSGRYQTCCPFNIVVYWCFVFSFHDLHLDIFSSVNHATCSWRACNSRNSTVHFSIVVLLPVRCVTSWSLLNKLSAFFIFVTHFYYFPSRKLGNFVLFHYVLSHCSHFSYCWEEKFLMDVGVKRQLLRSNNKVCLILRILPRILSY